MKTRKRILIFKSVVMVLMILVTISCNKENAKSLPVVTTQPVSNITAASATSGGTITSAGDAPVTECGICWSTNQAPQIVDHKTIDSLNSGSFISSLTGLNPNTDYYVRAYASNSVGTGYGNEIQFTTADGVMDVDGNVYSKVTITMSDGKKQVWLAENLKTTKYNDGISILNLTDNTAWAGLTDGAYSWYNNDEATYKNPYGALYNWHAVNSGKLCPENWHVPTKAEWLKLVISVGGEDLGGGYLKEADTVHWLSPNTHGSNFFGFTALPGGTRSGIDGSFRSICRTGYWWSSTSISYSAWERLMYYDKSKISELQDLKTSGKSVRCLRDF